MGVTMQKTALYIINVVRNAAAIFSSVEKEARKIGRKKCSRFVLGRSSVPILVGTPGMLTEIFYGFPQYLHHTFRIVPLSGCY
jgi:hypothetical protein